MPGAMSSCVAWGGTGSSSMQTCCCACSGTVCRRSTAPTRRGLSRRSHTTSSVWIQPSRWASSTSPTYGVWLHYEADADDHDAVDEAGATVLRRGLTDSGLAHLSGLRKLTLSGCQAVSDAGVCAVLLRRCPDLVEISLSERMHRHHRRDAQRPRSKLPAPQQAERLALHPSLRRPRVTWAAAHR